MGCGDLTTWDEMKLAMKKRFEPGDYKQRVRFQLNQLRQGNLSVEEYTRQFQHLATHAVFKWTNKVLVAMYQQGLHPQLSMGLSFTHFPILDDAIQVAYQINENMNDLSYKLLIVESSSKCVIAGYSSFSRSIHQTKTSSPPRSLFQFSPSKSRGFKGSTSKPKTDQCFTCKGFGHHKSQYPSKFVGITYKSTEEDDLEEVYEPTLEMISEIEALEEEEARVKGVKSILGIMCPMFALQKAHPVQIKKKKVGSIELM